MHFHIILTERCNSQCRYCYEKSLEEFDNELQKKWKFDFSTPTEFSVEISELRKFLEQDKFPVIIFYGGEPLLQIKKIQEIMDSIDAKVCIQTNGKLLNELPEKHLKRFSKILVSIDGSRERTDYNRGEGSFDLAVKNVRGLRKRGFSGELTARMTLTFPDIFEQIKNILELGVFDSIHWQLDAGFYKNDFDSEKFSSFVLRYNEQILKLADFWVENMNRGIVLKLYPFLGIFESLYYGKKTKLRCGSGHSNYSITPSGKITACPIMNNITNFYCGDLKSKISRLKKIYVKGACLSCNFLDICGGRCLYSNRAELWPPEGQKLICETVIFLINSIKARIPEIQKLIEKGIVSERDFEYEKYFGPEIIP